ncbi:ATP-binding protein [Teichococcus vastitatis]|uniref:ATP-binding protein n=1 Tax=Teichococcus vastitatis TaxID=2307076 RepID=UPI000E713D2C|nr:ATP-binding protein [Pseudoroseomonas vastitatis]
MQQWFEVDRNGLAKLLERKGREFLLYELVQNAWDQDSTRVDVTLTKEPGSRLATIRVEDDDPDGFKTLPQAWTLFAESRKKADAEKRGRFNLGEKLVLALCQEAEIVSTTEAVRFDASGRTPLRRRRERGTVFEGKLRLTNEEFAACCAAVHRLLPPAGITTTFNGRLLPPRTPCAEFEASLRTEIADAEGNLRPATRKASVRVFPVVGDEVATLYEMGIPVVPTGDTYHVDVQQKVPLSLDRDNVPPAYLRTLRTAVLNVMHDRLPAEQATAVWVREALGTRDVSSAAVRTVVANRFGPKSVVYDPSDREANKLAVVAGYTVVHGSQLSAEEWANVRTAGALLPAGQVTPSPKPFTPGGPPLQTLPREAWSDAEQALVALYQRLAPHLIGQPIEVKLALAPDAFWAACYGPAGPLYLNRPKLGRRFFKGGASEEALDLLIHELGHHYAGDHLSDDYYRALTKLGARLALAVARDPRLLSCSTGDGE